MKIKLSLILCLSVILLYGCAQQQFDEVFVPTDQVPVEEEPVSDMDNVTMEENVTGEVEEMAPEEDEEETEEPEVPDVSETEEGLPLIEVTEGELVTLNLQATDPDGDPLTYTFNEPLDENGEWQTEVGDAGEYRTNVTASDGKTDTTQTVLIRVEALNKPPVITMQDTITVSEGETVELTPQLSDPDGDEVSVSYSGWMQSSTYKTTFNDEGEHTVTITASDGTKETTKDVTVVVENVNRAPIIGTVQDVVVTEGEMVDVDVIAADPDKDEVTVTFTPPLDNQGQWQTEEGDAERYRVTVTASDGELKVEKSFFVVVEALNKAPTISGVPSEVEVQETETVSFDPEVSDPDGDEVEVEYSGWMTSSEYTTTYNDGDDDPSVYTVTITATDENGNAESVDVTVRVFNKNRPPQFVVS